MKPARVTLVQFMPCDHRPCRPLSQLLTQAAYEGFKELDGGSCSFSELQLCSMQGRQAGSYYPVVTTICIGGKAADQHEP